MRYYQDAAVTGSANTTVWDDGIQSNEAEHKHIVGVLLSVSGQIGDIVKANIARETVLSIPDYNIQSYGSSGSTNVQQSVNQPTFFELNFDLKVGDTFKLGIECGATAKDLSASYVYELK